jgi:hypothetical protein
MNPSEDDDNEENQRIPDMILAPLDSRNIADQGT